MVSITTLPRRLVRSQDGISLTEGLISFPLVVLMFAAFVEFGYVVFQWNQTAKAMQLGARIVAVSDPMVNLDAWAIVPSGVEVGDTVPPTQAASCMGTGCLGIDRLVNGGGRWPGLRAFNPRIGPENIRVTYTQSGLGYYGRPGGPVATITVEAVDVRFDLPLIGAIICALRDCPDGVLREISVPPMPVSITSEDMRTAS